MGDFISHWCQQPKSVGRADPTAELLSVFVDAILIARHYVVEDHEENDV